MEPITTNQQKYENYKEQMSRLNKALRSEFYLEAIFIEYAILEDRLESALRHSKKFNTNKPISIERKCSLVRKLTEETRGIARKYFTDGLMDEILLWKDSRNRLIHALMKQSLHTDDLLAIATQGKELVRKVDAKVSAYNRALEKKEIRK